MYRVEIKMTPSSPWRDNGIIVTNLDSELVIWAEIVRELKRHAFRLVAI